MLHINGESGSNLLIYNYENVYWAVNVLLAQTTGDGACAGVASDSLPLLFPPLLP